MNRLFKTGIFTLVLCLSVLLCETLYFVWVGMQPSDRISSDAIVVFSGSNRRVQHGYDLAKQGIAPILIISPAGQPLIDRYEKKYGTPGNARYLLEKKAETTFTNALYSAELIRSNNLTSVLLVTADYHMPRAFFLLKLLLLDTDCRIDMSKLNTHEKRSTGRKSEINRLKMTYNEMIQLWGSLLEGGLHFMGESNTWLRKRSPGVTRWLREHLLFDVPCLECG